MDDSNPIFIFGTVNSAFIVIKKVSVLLFI